MDYPAAVIHFVYISADLISIDGCKGTCAR